jgi:hypothetical protein
MRVGKPANSSSLCRRHDGRLPTSSSYRASNQLRRVSRSGRGRPQHFWAKTTISKNLWYDGRHERAAAPLQPPRRLPGRLGTATARCRSPRRGIRPGADVQPRSDTLPRTGRFQDRDISSRNGSASSPPYGSHAVSGNPSRKSGRPRSSSSATASRNSRNWVPPAFRHVVEHGSPDSLAHAKTLHFVPKLPRHLRQSFPKVGTASRFHSGSHSRNSPLVLHPPRCGTRVSQLPLSHAKRYISSRNSPRRSSGFGVSRSRAPGPPEGGTPNSESRIRRVS